MPHFNYTPLDLKVDLHFPLKGIRFFRENKNGLWVQIPYDQKFIEGESVLITTENIADRDTILKQLGHPNPENKPGSDGEDGNPTVANAATPIARGAADGAMKANEKTGGIDLTPAKMNLQTKVVDSRFRGNDIGRGGNDTSEEVLNSILTPHSLRSSKTPRVLCPSSLALSLWGICKGF